MSSRAFSCGGRNCQRKGCLDCKESEHEVYYKRRNKLFLKFGMIIAVIMIIFLIYKTVTYYFIYNKCSNDLEICEAHKPGSGPLYEDLKKNLCKAIENLRQPANMCCGDFITLHCRGITPESDCPVDKYIRECIKPLTITA